MADLQSFAVKAVTDGNVSALDLMHMPSVYNKLVGQYPEQDDLMFLQVLGHMQEVVNQTTYQWHEENRLLSPITVAAKATVIANKTVRITLDAADHYDSGKYSYVRTHDTVEFANGAKGVVIAKNNAVPGAHTIDVQRMNSKYDVVAATVVGAKVGVTSMAFAEGGAGYNETIMPKTTVYTGKLQIFRDTFEITTSEQGNGTWVDFTWPAGYPNAGQSGRFYFIKAEGDTFKRYRKKRELGLMINDQNDEDIIIDADEPAIRTTRGFVPHVQQYSNLMGYANKPTMSTFDTMIRIQNKNYGDRVNLVLNGLDFGLALKDFGTDLMAKGAVLYNSSSGEPMESVSLGFSAFNFPGTQYTYHFKSCRAFADADTTGLPGFKYSGMAIVCPTSKKKDPKSGNMEDPMCIRYKTPIGGGAKGWYKLWEHGGGAQVPTNGLLKRTMEIQSEEGIQVFGAARFTKIDKY